MPWVRTGFPVFTGILKTYLKFLHDSRILRPILPFDIPESLKKIGQFFGLSPKPVRTLNMPLFFILTEYQKH